MNDTTKEWEKFFEWCKEQGKDPKNGNSLHEYMAILMGGKK